MHLKLVTILLCLYSSIALADWIPADPIGETVPTPYPGPSPLQSELNQLRKANSLYEMVSTYQLDCAAYKHAKDMYQHRFCSHIGSDGSTFTKRAEDCNTAARSEVIGCGFHSAQSVLDAWQRDRGSRALLLDQHVVAVGAANVGDVWVLVFK